MDATFWNERWAEGRIGFHEGRPNDYLVRHVDRLGAARRVLVPLCGKAHDLAFLASRGHTVVGVELVEDAVRAFFAEHDVTPTVERCGALTAYRAGAITIFAGDWFATGAELLGPVDAFYDRAALIALPPAMRPRYAAHLRAVAPAATGLLITLEYPADAIDGPPFSVLADEVHALHGDGRVAELEHGPARGGRLPPGVGRERCFVIAPAATTPA